MPLTAWPSVIPIPMPVYRRSVPMVAINAGMFSLWIRNAVNVPQSAPMAMADTNISRMTPTAGTPLISAGTNLDTQSAVRMDTRLPTPTVDRSLPPQISASMTPRARRPYSGNWYIMDLKMEGFINRDPLVAQNTRKNPTNRIQSANRCGSMERS